MRDASVEARADGTPRETSDDGGSGSHLGHEHRAEDREAEARGVVADRLGDAGRLAVGEPRRPVDGIRARRAEHQSHARPGEDDAPDLRAEVEVSSPCPAQRQKPTAASAQPSTTGRLAPTRSSIRPPICAATTKPRKKYRRTRLAPGRRLAEADLGVLAGEEERRDEDEHRDAEHDVLDEERPDPEDLNLDQRRLGAAARRSRTRSGARGRRRCRARCPDCSSPRSTTAGSRTRSVRRRRRSARARGSPCAPAGSR